MAESCRDAEWLNEFVHQLTKDEILDRVSEATGDDPHTVMTCVGFNLLLQAASMLSVTGELPAAFGVDLGKSLVEHVIDALEKAHAAQQRKN